MVLGRDRRAVSSSGSGEISAWTVADVARALRRARTTQGLRVDEVAQGAGVAATDLGALESATLDRFPDSLSALRVVRRSADYLGLPGDQLALALMERWPLQSRRGAASSDPTSLVTAVGADATAVIDLEPPTMVPGGRRLGSSRDPRFGAAAAAALETGQVVLDRAPAAELDDDAETQSVPAAPAVRRREDLGDVPPGWLRVLVVVAVVAVLAVVTGLVVHEVTKGGGGRSASPKPASTSGSGKVGSGRHVSDKTVSFTSTSTSPTSAVITVGSPSFTVTVSAVGYPAWVKVTAPTHQGPLFAGLLKSGQSQSFSVHQALTVEVGSVAGHATVQVGSAQVGHYVPPAAPYHMTFKPGP